MNNAIGPNLKLFLFKKVFAGFMNNARDSHKKRRHMFASFLVQSKDSKHALRLGLDNDKLPVYVFGLGLMHCSQDL